ncbi:MAG: ComEC/Rec2 family competence protein [Sphaerochaeta sp.]
MRVYVLSILFCYAGFFAPSFFSYPALIGGGGAVVLLIVLLTKKRAFIAPILISVILYVLFGRAVRLTNPTYGFEKKRIAALEGVLSEDSLLTKGGNQLLRIKLNEVESEEGMLASATGVITALISADEVLIASSHLHLSGSFTDDGSLFIAEDFAVTSLSRLGLWRRGVAEALYQLLGSRIADERVRALGVMLLLGQSDSSAFPLKELAKNAGLSHLLALSGLHLTIFLSLSTMICSLGFGPYWAKRIGMILPTIFVIIAGPKPSLLRALLLSLCSLFPLGGSSAIFSYLLALALQLIFTPTSVSSLAFLLSYGAYTMLLIAPYLPSFIGSTSTLAVIGVAPITLLLEGSWNIGGIFLTTLVSLLIHASMLCSLGVVFFGSFMATPLSWCEGWITTILQWADTDLLRYGAFEYFIALALLLTLIIALIYAKHTTTKQEHYELELCLRFPNCDHRPLRDQRVGDEQEVWTKLSHLPGEPTANRRSVEP